MCVFKDLRKSISCLPTSLAFPDFSFLLFLFLVFPFLSSWGNSMRKSFLESADRGKRVLSTSGLWKRGSQLFLQPLLINRYHLWQLWAIVVRTICLNHLKEKKKILKSGVVKPHTKMLLCFSFSSLIFSKLWLKLYLNKKWDLELPDLLRSRRITKMMMKKCECLVTAMPHTLPGCSLIGNVFYGEKTIRSKKF